MKCHGAWISWKLGGLKYTNTKQDFFVALPSSCSTPSFNRFFCACSAFTASCPVHLSASFRAFLRSTAWAFLRSALISASFAHPESCSVISDSRVEAASLADLCSMAMCRNMFDGGYPTRARSKNRTDVPITCHIISHHVPHYFSSRATLFFTILGVPYVLTFFCISPPHPPLIQRAFSIN